jgi:hypothetical protein
MVLPCEPGFFFLSFSLRRHARLQGVRTFAAMRTRLLLPLFLFAAACSSSGGTDVADGSTNDVLTGGDVTEGGSSQDGSSGQGHDASSDGRSDSPAACLLMPTDAGTCNTLALTGTVVTRTCVAGEPPTAHGGTVEDGTYVLTSVTIYAGCPDGGREQAIDRGTWVICGDQWETVQEGTPVGTTSNQNFTITASGSSLTSTVVP